MIDIGSNTVRLVVYSGPDRVPHPWLNEKVTARLGRDLSTTGRMPDEAISKAMAAVGRYAIILRDLGVEEVQTVATAAVREAENGSALLDRVRELDLNPRLLSGEEEAQYAAFGVIGAFPGAQGTVADLGGGSLELMMVERGECRAGLSLPLGTLRLPALRKKGLAGFRKSIAKNLAQARWAGEHPGPMYMVGGTWRALGAFAMHSLSYPATNIHAFALGADEAERVVKELAETPPERLASLPGISSSRASELPDAAALLRTMLTELRPDGLVFSTWGLREGLLFRSLESDERARDPLFECVAHFAEPRGGSSAMARQIARWSAAAVQPSQGSERLLLAAIQLALAAAHVEPNLRPAHAFEWAMDKRWIGLDLAGRASIAAALLAACGKVAPPPELERLATWDELQDAVSWGLAIRLARRLAAGSQNSLHASALERDGTALVLRLAEDRACIASERVLSDLKALAQWLALEPALEVVTSPLEGASRPRNLTQV